MQFGADTYRHGAHERMHDADILLVKDRLSSAVYVSGLAVEGMLRCLIWLRDKHLDERHDLRRLATRIERLGLLRDGESDLAFVSKVQGVARSWVNELRFADDEQTERWFRKIGTVRKHGRGAFRRAVKDHINRCSELVKRCEVLWQRQKSRRRS